jgi:hypothetical protein
MANENLKALAKSSVLITNASDSAGKEIIVPLRLSVTKREVEINEVTSIYGKANLAYLIENTFLLDKGFYVNEKTNDWLLANRLPLPVRVTNHLQEQYNKLSLSKSAVAEHSDKVEKVLVLFSSCSVWMLHLSLSTSSCFRLCGLTGVSQLCGLFG